MIGHRRRYVMRRRIIIGLLALVLLGGFAAYWHYNGDSADKLTIIRAAVTPYKIKPEDPGGKNIDNQDSAMMGLLDGGEGDDGKVEVLTPQEDDPEMPPINIDAPAGETGPEDPSLAETSPESAAEPDPDPAKTTDSAEAPETAKTADAAKTADSAEAPDTAETGDSGDSVDETADETASAEINTFYVQFAAFKADGDIGEKRAREAAAVLTTQHATRLDGKALTHVLNKKHWLVVSADPLPLADARKTCNVFRSAGQDCIIKELEQ